jgi:hypothetical protein
MLEEQPLHSVIAALFVSLIFTYLEAFLASVLEVVAMAAHDNFMRRPCLAAAFDGEFGIFAIVEPCCEICRKRITWTWGSHCG